MLTYKKSVHYSVDYQCKITMKISDKSKRATYEHKAAKTRSC